MDERELIEKKDAELLHSVREIIRDKELEKERISKSHKKRGVSFLFLVVGTGVLGGMIGLMFSGPESPKSLHSEPLVKTYAEKNEQAQSNQKGSWPSVWSGDVKKKTDVPEEKATVLATEKTETEQAVYYKDPDVKEPAEEKIVSSPAPPKKIEKKVAAAPPSPVETAPAPTPVAASDSDIRISKKAVCGVIKNREPYNAKNFYSISDDERVYVFTEVRTKELPTKINHIYYIDDKKLCDVSLAVKYPRTRTWSRVRLNNEKKAGKYRVEVVTEEGIVLETVNFEVAL